MPQTKSISCGTLECERMRMTKHSLPYSLHAAATESLPEANPNDSSDAFRCTAYIPFNFMVTTIELQVTHEISENAVVRVVIDDGKGPDGHGSTDVLLTVTNEDSSPVVHVNDLIFPAKSKVNIMIENKDSTEEGAESDQDDVNSCHLYFHGFVKS